MRAVDSRNKTRALTDGTFMDPIDRNPYAPPSSVQPAAAVPDDDPSFPRAWRFAGVLFLIHGAILFVDTLVADADPRTFLTTFWDAIVGCGLLARAPAYRRWGIYRVGLGLVIAVARLADAPSPWTQLVGALSLGGMLSLLLAPTNVNGTGTTKLITALSLAAFAPFVVLEAIGIAYFAVK